MATDRYLAIYTDDSDHALIVGWRGGVWSGPWAAKAEASRRAHPTPDAADVMTAMLDLAIQQGLCNPPIDTSGWESW